MAGQDETISLMLNGDVLIEDFATAVTAWKDILSGLESEVVGGEQVQWQIDHLAAGSFYGTLKAVYRSEVERGPAEEISRRFTRLSRDMRRGTIGGYSLPVRTAAKRITDLIGDRVTSIRIETNEDDAEITERIERVDVLAPAERLVGLVQGDRARGGTLQAFGIIRGVIQSISNRSSLRFTLYDAVTDRAVNCYMEKGNEDQMRDAWGKAAFVSGVVRRDPVTGNPTTIRDVNRIEIISPNARGSWRQAFGAAPARVGELSAEAAIRKLRDAD